MSEEAPSRPRLMTRLAAALHGEVSAETAEAYRRAGKRVYQDLLDAEEVRHEILASGGDLWSTSAAQRTRLVSTWNAFALQSLGEAFIEADYRADPSTVGFLPAVTAEQAAVFLGQVETWLGYLRRAASDDGYDVADQVHLPAPLPRWVEVEPCPPAHFAAMVEGAKSLRDKIQTALADFEAVPAPSDHAKDADQLRGLVAEADSRVDFAEQMYSPGAPRGVHEQAEAAIRSAVGAYYRLGQVLAAPALLRRAATGDPFAASLRRLPAPDEAGFDPWVLTDPGTRRHWARDFQARRAIQALWAADPDPAATLELQAQIDEALAEGAILAGVDAGGRHLGNYYCCPWSPIYVVRRPVVIGTDHLGPGEQFTLDVSAEEVGRGEPFVRRLLRGPFHPTDEVDYCDPNG